MCTVHRDCEGKLWSYQARVIGAVLAKLGPRSPDPQATDYPTGASQVKREQRLLSLPPFHLTGSLRMSKDQPTVPFCKL